MVEAGGFLRCFPHDFLKCSSWECCIMTTLLCICVDKQGFLEGLEADINTRDCNRSE
jgi:hypothetical protein